MQPARAIKEMSRDELQIELELQWSMLTQSAARWRLLRDEARQRMRRDMEAVLAEMVNRRIPPIKRRM
jgi:hypothetical protein